jgi:arsenate reductase (thioredoxin)
MKQTVLFLCTHNAVRSQMAEGLLNSLYPNRYQAYSAGIIKTGVDPTAIKILKELGIDISAHRSKTIDEFKGKTFDYVVTVCDNAKEACPYFPGKKVIHHAFYDPGTYNGTPEEILRKFRTSRDDIKTWIIQTFGKERTNDIDLDTK